jgi:hypothetical protein
VSRAAPAPAHRRRGRRPSMPWNCASATAAPSRSRACR